MFQVIILARESGLKLELSDIPVQSLVPEPLKARKTLNAHGFHHTRLDPSDVIFLILYLRKLPRPRSFWNSFLNMIKTWQNKERRLKLMVK